MSCFAAKRSSEFACFGARRVYSANLCLVFVMLYSSAVSPYLLYSREDTGAEIKQLLQQWTVVANLEGLDSIWTTWTTVRSRYSTEVQC